jgi:hypothetical protein
VSADFSGSIVCDEQGPVIDRIRTSRLPLDPQTMFASTTKLEGARATNENEAIAQRSKFSINEDDLPEVVEERRTHITRLEFPGRLGDPPF